MRCECRTIAAALYRGLLVNGVAYSEAVTTLSAATGQNLAAVGGAHAMTEAMLVGFLAVRGLECSFHFLSLFFYLFRKFFAKCGAKLVLFFKLHKSNRIFREKFLFFFSKTLLLHPQMTENKHFLHKTIA
jgi:hypothetical protein